MKKQFAILLVVTISWSVVAVAMADTKERGDIEKNIAKSVRQQSSKERMMPTPEVQLKRLSKGLQLTAEQQQQIKPILKDEYAKLAAIRQDDNLSPKQIQTQVEALRTETAGKIESFLTPEQKEKYSIARNEIRANKQKRIGENRKSRISNWVGPGQQPN